MNLSQKSALIAGLVALVFLGGSFWAVSSRLFGPTEDQCRQGNVAGAASIGGPFTLVSETGDVVTDAEVLTKPALVYFGYTFCPDVCPFDAARNADAVDLLAERGLDVLPVFITVDPERDTPELLAEWTDYMHPEMIGLTGSAEQVKAASQAYRTYYRKQEPEDADDPFYLVDHSVFTYLMMPDSGFAEFFGRDVSAEDMAERTACFIESAG